MRCASFRSRPVLKPRPSPVRMTTRTFCASAKVRANSTIFRHLETDCVQTIRTVELHYRQSIFFRIGNVSNSRTCPLLGNIFSTQFGQLSDGWPLLDKLERRVSHFIRLHIADRVRQLDIRVPFHALATELKIRRNLERFGDDGRRRNTPFFKIQRVVHTAQRAGTSASQCGYRHIHLLGHFFDHFISGGFRVMLFSPRDDSGHIVLLSEGITQGFQMISACSLVLSRSPTTFPERSRAVAQARFARPTLPPSDQ